MVDDVEVIVSTFKMKGHLLGVVPRFWFNHNWVLPFSKKIKTPLQNVITEMFC